ncbi:MAG: hypothetical protein OCC45_13330 [Desulfotalea sp.]
MWSDDYAIDHDSDKCCSHYPYCECADEEFHRKAKMCICGNPDCDGTCDRGLESRECPY